MDEATHGTGVALAVTYADGKDLVDGGLRQPVGERHGEGGPVDGGQERLGLRHRPGLRFRRTAQ
ncbi:hypothetical protein [Streptomyces sp. AM6-12]|uniref:hypothetical protein n=1 Tax=Streptomyces sp. AM6-12 TaxID=3345149 RepID=UPI003795571C